MRYLKIRNCLQGESIIDVDRPFRRSGSARPKRAQRCRGIGRRHLGSRTFHAGSSWSNATRKLFGVGPEAPVDYDLFLSLLDPQDRDRTGKRDAADRSRPAAISTFNPGCTRQSNAGHWVRARGTIVKVDGEPCPLSGIAIDIDEEKQLEEALRTRESHLRSILDTVPDAMIVIDEHGIMQFFSTAAERQFGYAEPRGDRPERQRADAGAGSHPPRRLPRALPIHRRTAHHRHRPDRDRQAPGRHDISDASFDRRDAIGRRALLHRLRARPDRASADPGPAAGIAIRTRPRLAPERDGRDGIRARARAQSAARRDQQLHEGLAPAAGGQHRSQHGEDRKRAGPRRRAGASAPARSSAGCAISSRAANPRSASRAFRS